MAIEDWAGTLKSKMAEITQIRQVHKYDEFPGSIMAFPTMIILPERGTGDLQVGRSWHYLIMNLYVAGQVLPEGYGLAVPFIKLVRNKLAANLKLDGTVESCEPLRFDEGNFYEGPGSLPYNQKNHLGIIFRVKVKESEQFTISA